MGFQVQAATQHRNGVAGAPFRIAIVHDDENGRMLLIDFSYPDGDTPNEGHVAVVNLDLAATGNIFMHEQSDESGQPVPNTGGNAWRGDVLGCEYRQAISEHINRQADA
jgi:hypothetical protein